MANVLSRTPPYRYLRSVNSPEYPALDWIFNPDMSPTIGFDPRYWTVAGDVVSVVDQAARDAIDAAEAVARKDAIADELDRAETFMRAFAGVLLDEINTLRSQHALAARSLAQLKTGVRGKL